MIGPLSGQLGPMGAANAGLKYSTKVLRYSPQAYWPATETSGNFADVSGNGNTGTPANITYANRALPSNSMDFAPLFNGTSSLVDCTNASIFNVGIGDFTMMMWMWAANANQFCIVVGKRDGVTPFKQYEMGIGSINSGGVGVPGKQIFITTYDGVIFASPHAASYHTTADVINGNWHCCVTRRASGVLTIWVDGVSKALTADVANTTPTNNDNTKSFQFGASSSTFFTTGNLGHVAFWNSALADAAIVDLAVAI
jgi:hypothetical protein